MGEYSVDFNVYGWSVHPMQGRLRHEFTPRIARFPDMLPSEEAELEEESEDEQE